jgi:hypothetical protein
MLTRKKWLICLLLAIPEIVSQSASAGCYYKQIQQCLPVGYTLHSSDVRCHMGSVWMTLQNQTNTAEVVYTLKAKNVDADHSSGYTNKIISTIKSSIMISTTIVDPDTCQVTVTPNAGGEIVECGASWPDTNSPACWFVYNTPETHVKIRYVDDVAINEIKESEVDCMMIHKTRIGFDLIFNERKQVKSRLKLCNKYSIFLVGKIEMPGDDCDCKYQSASPDGVVFHKKHSTVFV